MVICKTAEDLYVRFEENIQGHMMADVVVTADLPMYCQSSLHQSSLINNSKVHVVVRGNGKGILSEYVMNFARHYVYILNVTYFKRKYLGNNTLSCNSSHIFKFKF